MGSTATPLQSGPRRRAFLKHPKLDRGQRQGARWHVVDADRRALYTRELAQQHGITGELFQSKKEAKVYIARLEQQANKVIRNLRRGKKERIQLHTTNADGLKVKVTSYEPDFLYEEQIGRPGGDEAIAEAFGEVPVLWTPVVEDVKGWRQDIYKLKKRWVEAEYGIVIRET